MAFYHDLKGYGPEKAAWIAQRLLELRADLELQIRVRRRSNSLIIGSWNIRAFDDGRPRMDESFHYISEIIDNFDICAVQEVKSDLAPLRRWFLEFSQPGTEQMETEELLGVVHSMSDPEPLPAGIALHIDFGSAPIAAVAELAEAAAQAGARHARLGSFEGL